ncbi:uncharacterized protein ACNLHF_015277 [Anomaloglossus baeobatrachus]
MAKNDDFENRSRRNNIRIVGIPEKAIYPDYSISVQKLRMTFTGVKRRLREIGVQYSMMFPAKLRVTVLDRSP